MFNRLLTTEVLDNGVNIIDESVSHLLTSGTEIISVLQQIGRVRIKPSGGHLTLLLPDRSRKFFSVRWMLANKKLKAFKTFKHADEKKLIEMGISGSLQDIEKCLYKNELTHSYKLSPLSEVAWAYYANEYREMMDRLKTDDKAWVKQVYTWLNKCFDPVLAARERELAALKSELNDLLLSVGPKCDCDLIPYEVKHKPLLLSLYKDASFYEPYEDFAMTGRTKVKLSKRPKLSGPDYYIDRHFIIPTTDYTGAANISDVIAAMPVAASGGSGGGRSGRGGGSGSSASPSASGDGTAVVPYNNNTSSVVIRMAAAKTNIDKYRIIMQAVADGIISEETADDLIINYGIDEDAALQEMNGEGGLPTISNPLTSVPYANKTGASNNSIMNYLKSPSREKAQQMPSEDPQQQKWLEQLASLSPTTISSATDEQVRNMKEPKTRRKK